MMGNVVGNDPRHINLKQILLSLGLFFSFSSLSAMCPQTVGSISLTEGVWTLLSRIGVATNVIESQICALDVAMSSSSCCDIGCTYQFGQSDIGAGGVYTISAPGTYCLKQNVSFTTGAAITVNSSYVTIDLEGHTLDGGSNPTTAIKLVGSHGNLLIKNGVIQNLGAGAYPLGVGISDSGAGGVDGITLQDLSFQGVSTSAIQFANNTFDGLLIERCKAFAAGNINPTNVIGLVVRDCRIEQSGSGFLIANCQNVVMSDCVAQNCASDGFHFQPYTSGGSSAVRLQNCVAQQCGSSGTGNGFWFSTLGTGFFYAIDIINCDADSNGQNGFLLSSSIPFAGGVLFATRFQDCHSASNGVCGFLLINPAGGAGGIIGAVFDSCVAQFNIGDGFGLANISGAFMRDVTFHNCVAQNNAGGAPVFLGTMFTGDGFGIGTSSASTQVITNVVCADCVSEFNNGDGFGFGAESSNNDLFNCNAIRNDGAGFSFAATNALSTIHACTALSNNGFGFTKTTFTAADTYFTTNQAFHNVAGDYNNVNSGLNGQATASIVLVIDSESVGYWENVST